MSPRANGDRIRKARHLAQGTSASKCMPATVSTTRAPRRSRRLPEIVELNIGHFLIGEAVFDGLDNAIRMMRAAMDRGRGKGAAA